METANTTQHYDKMIFTDKEMLIADNSEETYFHFKKRYSCEIQRILLRTDHCSDRESIEHEEKFV